MQSRGLAFKSLRARTCQMWPDVMSHIEPADVAIHAWHSDMTCGHGHTISDHVFGKTGRLQHLSQTTVHVTIGQVLRASVHASLQSSRVIATAGSSVAVMCARVCMTCEQASCHLRHFAESWFGIQVVASSHLPNVARCDVTH